MGQYHILVNLDKREFVHPHDVGLGLRLQEQFSVPLGMGDILLILLAGSNGRGGGDLPEDPIVGSWAGDRIAMVGDYGKKGDLSDPDIDVEAVYGACEYAYGNLLSEYTNISSQVAVYLSREFGLNVKGAGWRTYGWAENLF